MCTFTIIAISFLFAENLRRPSVLGKPVKRFPPVGDHKINFLDITNNAAIPDTAPNKHAMKFWHHILQNAEMLIR